jgi:hypothetical protein
LLAPSVIQQHQQRFQDARLARVVLSRDEIHAFESGELQLLEPAEILNL